MCFYGFWNRIGIHWFPHSNRTIERLVAETACPSCGIHPFRLSDNTIRLLSVFYQQNCLHMHITPRHFFVCLNNPSIYSSTLLLKYHFYGHHQNIVGIRPSYHTMRRIWLISPDLIKTRRKCTILLCHILKSCLYIFFENVTILVAVTVAGAIIPSPTSHAQPTQFEMASFFPVRLHFLFYFVDLS